MLEILEVPEPLRLLHLLVEVVCLCLDDLFPLPHFLLEASSKLLVAAHLVCKQFNSLLKKGDFTCLRVNDRLRVALKGNEIISALLDDVVQHDYLALALPRERLDLRFEFRCLLLVFLGKLFALGVQLLDLGLALFDLDAKSVDLVFLSTLQALVLGPLFDDFGVELMDACFFLGE